MLKAINPHNACISPGGATEPLGVKGILLPGKDEFSSLLVFSSRAVSLFAPKVSACLTFQPTCPLAGGLGPDTFVCTLTLGLYMRCLLSRFFCLKRCFYDCPPDEG